MTQKEFLNAIELSRDEFRDLLDKFDSFNQSLSAVQREAVKRSMPSMTQALRSLGGDLTSEQLTTLVKKTRPVKAPDDDGGSYSGFIRRAKANPKLP